MSINFNDIKDCFYDPTTNQIVDVVNPHDGKGIYGRETIEETVKRYPDAVVMDFDEAIKAKEEKHKQPPQIITAERFFEMLEVLPPVGWVDKGYAESFKMSERESGNITGIYARIGRTYYHMVDSIYTPHEAIIAACKAIGDGGTGDDYDSFVATKERELDAYLDMCDHGGLNPATGAPYKF